jgi:signal transduction histidine kinase
VVSADRHPPAPTATRRFRGQSVSPWPNRWPIARRLGLPLLIVLPVALTAIILAVCFSLDPLRRFRAPLESRGARDLSEVPAEGLPTEIGPLADTPNSLLAKLHEAFEAERSFAANAPHELRTPLAGAIAQVQAAPLGDPRPRRRSSSGRDRGEPSCG